MEEGCGLLAEGTKLGTKEGGASSEPPRHTGFEGREEEEEEEEERRVELKPTAQSARKEDWMWSAGEKWEGEEEEGGESYAV